MGYTVTTKTTMSRFASLADATRKYNACQTAVLKEDGRVIKEKGPIHCKSLLIEALVEALHQMSEENYDAAYNIISDELGLIHNKQIIEE